MKLPAAFSVVCSDDGRLLCSIHRRITITDLVSRQRLSVSRLLPHPSAGAFSPDSLRLAVKHTDGRIIVMEPRSGDVLHNFDNRGEGEGCGPLFSPDGAELVDGSWNGVLTHRSAHDGTIISRMHFPGEMISRLSHDRLRHLWLFEHKPKVKAGENMPAPGYVSLRTWPFSSSKVLNLSFGMHFEAATLSPEGTRIAFIEKTVERRLTVARVTDGQILAVSAPLAVSGSATGDAIAWTNDGCGLLAVSKDQFLAFEARSLTQTGHWPSLYPASIAPIPGGTDVVFGAWKGSRLVKM